jgi:hypothetical protein
VYWKQHQGTDGASAIQLEAELFSGHLTVAAAAKAKAILRTFRARGSAAGDFRSFRTCVDLAVVVVVPLVVVILAMGGCGRP